MLSMIDAAYPDFTKMPVKPDVIAFYIGGNTPHVWTTSEIADAKKNARYLLPIWVRSNPASYDGYSEAMQVRDRLRSLGMPQETLVCLDLETSIDADYTNGWLGGIHASNYFPLLYGGANTLPKNVAPLWIAHYTGVPHLEPGSIATQWTNGTFWDQSVIVDHAPLWDVRGGNVVSATGPASWDAADWSAFTDHLNQWFTNAAKLGESLEEAIFKNNNGGTNPYVLRDLFQRDADAYDKVVKIYNKVING